jgi:hypothetical protein
MPIVDIYNVHSPKEITLTTTPGDDVSGYSAKLFLFQDINDNNDNGTEVRSWNSDELNHGATFHFDATGDQQYQIALAATASAATTLDTTVTFSSGIPDSRHIVPLVTGTLNELTWNFVPIAS